ncbi:MAG: endonuclease/exonuclease/phosphatase family protein [Bacteroidales bacterium]|nr:endonuclease/exonuclease/phosphatase family protein [Bacteroidales bacterium]
MKRIVIIALVFLAGLSIHAQTRQNYVVGFYNLENLFDTYDDPVKNDEEFLPEGKNQWTEVKYQKKLFNMATVIAEMAKANKAFHTILGVSEIENRLVLEDLVSHPLLSDANFQIVHYDGPDRRGVDVGLLYRADQFEYMGSESIPFSFEDTQVPITLSKEEQDYFRTRDILMVHGLIDGEHIAFYVAHLPSRMGGKGSDLRSLGADIIKRHSDRLSQKYPGIKMIVMGDMNDDPHDDSMSKWLGAVRNIEDTQKGGFFNPFWDMLLDGYGSLGYRDVWSIYDQVIPSETLVNAPENTLKVQKIGKKGYYGAIFKRPFMVTQQGQYKNYPFRTFSNGKFVNGYSDHFPAYIVIGK